MGSDGGPPAQGRLTDTNRGQTASMAKPRVSARSRLGLCAVGGLVSFAVAMALTPWQVATLIGWDVTAVAWVGWVCFSVLDKDSADTQRLATAEDDSRAAADALLVSA